MQLSRYVDCFICVGSVEITCTKRETLLLSITITAYIEIVEIDKKFYLKKFFVHEELMDWEKKTIGKNEYERDIF